MVVRVAIYATAVIMFIALRGRVDWGQLARNVSSAPRAADSTLTLAGVDVAPLLVDTMVRRYGDDYPSIHIARMPGTTARQQRKTPVRSISSTRCQASTG